MLYKTLMMICTAKEEALCHTKTKAGRLYEGDNQVKEIEKLFTEGLNADIFFGMNLG